MAGVHHLSSQENPSKLFTWDVRFYLYQWSTQTWAGQGWTKKVAFERALTLSVEISKYGRKIYCFISFIFLFSDIVYMNILALFFHDLYKRDRMVACLIPTV